MKKIKILDHNTPPFISFDMTYFINDEDTAKIKENVYRLKEFPFVCLSCAENILEQGRIFRRYESWSYSKKV